MRCDASLTFSKVEHKWYLMIRYLNVIHLLQEIKNVLTKQCLEEWLYQSSDDEEENRHSFHQLHNCTAVYFSILMIIEFRTLSIRLNLLIINLIFHLLGGATLAQSVESLASDRKDQVRDSPGENCHVR